MSDSNPDEASYPNLGSVNDGNNHRVSNVAEFYNDVHVYGKLYADLVGGLTGDGDGTLVVSNLDVTNNVNIGGDLNVEGLIDTDYLTVFQRLNVGAAGTIFVAISTTNGRDGEGQIGGRVGVGTTQPAGRFEVGIGGEGLDPEDPADPFESIFIIHPEGGVGIGTTAPAGKFQVGVDCLTITNDCRVGLGTTQPTQRFQVKHETQGAVISDAGQVGVRTSTFEGTEVFKVNSTDKCFVITDDGNVGIGSLDPTAITGYDSGIDGIIKLNVEGTVKIDRNIIDSADSPGANGYYLARDGNGIRWQQASPINLDGMYVQDEGANLPVGGTAQLFQYLNFVQLDSQGLGVDTLLPIPDPANPTAVAKIQTQDLWGHTNSNNNSPIYRMTKVGIKNQSPAVELDVTGELHVTGAVDFDDTLNVDGDTTLNAKLDVDGLATFNDGTDSTGTTSGSVQIDGGVGIVKKLNIGGQTRVYNTTDASSCTTGALIVSGGVGIAKKLFVCGDTELEKLTIDDTTDSVNCTTGALIVKGGVGIGKNVNICGEVDIVASTQSTDKDSGALVVEGGVGIEKNLNVGQNTKLQGTLELENHIIDKFDSNGVGLCKTDYRLSTFDTGVGVGVSWRPSGVQTKRTIWVTKNGCDINSGLLEGDAKYTIAAAAAIAQEGDTIKVRSGVYYEDNPVGLRTDVAISGEDLRLVTVVPNNTNKDLFHVRNGCLVENLSFKGSGGTTTTHHGLAAVAFPPLVQADWAIGGYIAPGPSNEGPRGRYQSPYVRNCTNFMTGSIGMKIDGDHVDASYTGTNDLGQDLKSMVCDSFTQYNEAGIGVSITNKGYAQLVSIFTIACEKAIYCDSGGQCDLTNSNSSFGKFGLVADGTSDVEFDGTLAVAMDPEADSIIVANCQDQGNNNRTPFDGQGAYFHLDMADYPDTISTAVITEPMQTIRSIIVENGGNPGDYAASAPPLVTATLPEGPEAIIAEFSPNVSAAGTITSVDVIASGRNFLPTQNVVISISGTGNAQLTADMDPILYTVSESTEVSNIGISTVTFNEFIPYGVKSTSKVEFVRLSRIITSSHSFEYVGAGQDINTANPFQAGKPIPENEVVAINGGQVPFTSTDQKGNFRIGDGLTIDQTTSTIRGRDFNRAIQAQLTPLILALR